MKTSVVTAPEHKYFPPKSLKIFLAGGICNCVDWQKQVIEKLLPETLDGTNYESCYLINPRRDNFVMKEGESERQIEWEFDMLERCEMFTMYFAGGESDQPICMYELGRNIERIKARFPRDWKHRIVITCEDTYKRLEDVLIQVRLATDDQVEVNVKSGTEAAVKAHSERIEKNIRYIYYE